MFLDSQQKLASSLSSNPFSVTCLFFAESKEVTGTKEFVFPIQAPISLADFKSIHLLGKYPQLQQVLLNSLFAINLEYVESDAEDITILSSNCEVAVLPPVSGG